MPRRFQFKLEPVLQLRERAERDRQLAVAALERERLMLEDTLRTIQTEIGRARDDLRSRLQGSIAYAEDEELGGLAGVRFQAGATLHLALKAQRTAIELAGAMKRLDSARRILAAATAERKAVQLLKDKAREDYRRRLERLELEAVDELSVMRHGRFSSEPIEQVVQP